MKTQANKKLYFKKSVVTELNSNQLKTIYGGTGTAFEEEVEWSRFTSHLCKPNS